MPRFFNPSNVPKPASRYTQAIAHSAIYKRLVISGQIGMTAEGQLAKGLEAQMEQAFDNLIRIVEAAQLDKSDLIKITVYATVPGSVAAYRKIRENKLGSYAPCATYIEITGLASPDLLVEIEGEAVREAAP
jgi:2-iminobutanoate/2-iminopropanoate deaminase